MNYIELRCKISRNFCFSLRGLVLTMRKLDTLCDMRFIILNYYSVNVKITGINQPSTGLKYYGSKMDASNNLWRKKRIRVRKTLILKDSHPYIYTIHKEQDVPAIGCFCTVFYKIYPILGRLG